MNVWRSGGRVAFWHTRRRSGRTGLLVARAAQAERLLPQTWVPNLSVTRSAACADQTLAPTMLGQDEGRTNRWIPASLAVHPPPLSVHDDLDPRRGFASVLEISGLSVRAAQRSTDPAAGERRPRPWDAGTDGAHDAPPRHRAPRNAAASRTEIDNTGVVDGSRITVLLVNMYPLIVEAVANALGADPGLEVVPSDCDPEHLSDAVQSAGADVVMIDCTFDQERWPPAIAALRQASVGTRVLVITTREDLETLSPFIQARAVGCIIISQPSSEFAAAVRRVHAGDVLFPPAVLVRLLDENEAPRRSSSPAGNGILAPREREVLTAMATGLSTEEVAESLGITIHTVRTHLKNVLVKLQARSKLQAVMIALREGLISLPEKPE